MDALSLLNKYTVTVTVTVLSVAPCFPMYVSYSYEIMILAQVWRSLIQKSHSKQYSPEGLPVAPCS